LFILSEFEWKSTGIKPLDYDETPDHDETPQGHKSPHLLGQLNLEITLTKRLPPSARGGEMERNGMVNGGSLTDDAFRSKKFTVRIEQGKFVLPADIKNYPELPAIVGDKSISRFLSWTRRLVFDISPYPPESEWKETRWKVKSENWCWDLKEFVGKSPEMKRAAAERAAVRHS
jgi:hypothetical protein